MKIFRIYYSESHHHSVTFAMQAMEKNHINIAFVKTSDVL